MVHYWECFAASKTSQQTNKWNLGNPVPNIQNFNSQSTDIKILPAFVNKKWIPEKISKLFQIFQTVRNLSSGVFSCHFQIFGMLKNILEQTSNKTIFLSDSQQTELKSLPIAIGLTKLDPKKPSRVIVIETGSQSHLMLLSI